MLKMTLKELKEYVKDMNEETILEVEFFEDEREEGKEND